MEVLMRDGLEATNHPGFVGLKLERLLPVGAESVSALALAFCDGDFEDWNGCGADFFLLREFEPWDDTLLWGVDSGLDAARLRVRVGS
jgi:hypothetical protein